MTPPLTPQPWTLLGVAPGADTDTIKRAFRRQAMRHHPDRDASPDAAERFRLIHAAYEQLLHAHHERRPDPIPPARPTGRCAATRAASACRHVERTTARDRFLFRALHATGLCFGLTVVAGAGLGAAFLEQGHLHLLLTLPGLAIIPDSIAGLRR
jgi:hypothetical protein